MITRSPAEGTPGYGLVFSLSLKKSKFESLKKHMKAKVLFDMSLPFLSV